MYVTKALPKEMLPIVDKPTIQCIVEEASGLLWITMTVLLNLKHILKEKVNLKSWRGFYLSGFSGLVPEWKNSLFK